MSKDQKRRHGIKASAELATLAREHVERLGIKAAAQRVGVAGEALLRIAAQIPTRPGTLALAAHHYGVDADVARARPANEDG